MGATPEPNDERSERDAPSDDLLRAGPARRLTVIACHVAEGAGFRWQPRWVNGQELAGWAEGPALHAFTTHLRAAGWSLTDSRQSPDDSGAARLILSFTFSQDAY